MDRLLLGALREVDADICGGCGHHRTDTLNPLHDRANPQHVAYYDTGLPWTCLACAAKDLAIARASKGREPEDLAGLQWAVELVPRKSPAPARHPTPST